MEIYVIGIQKQGNHIDKVRLLQLDGSEQSVKDVDIPILKGLIKAYPKLIKNVTIQSNGGVKGTNGQLDRYGLIDITRQITVLREITDQQGRVLGYLCADTTGKVAEIRKNQIIRLSEKLPIANGKVIEKQPGQVYISPIRGKYETIQRVVSTPAPQEQVQSQAQAQVQSKPQVQAQPKSQAQAQPKSQVQAQPSQGQNQQDISTISIEDVFKLIAELKTFERFYKDRGLISIVKSIESNGKAYELQKKILVKKYAEFVQNNEKRIAKAPETKAPEAKAPEAKAPETKAPETKAPETKAPETKAPETKAPETKKIQLDLNKLEVADVNLLSFVIHKDKKAYVKGFKDNNIERQQVRNVVIPDYITVKNVKYPVVGIEFQAFARTKIGGITTGPLMQDVGQQAFLDCIYLEVADFSKQTMTFVQASMCRGCQQLKVVKLGALVERIHEQAFEECKQLEYIQLPSECWTVARHGFAECKALKCVEHNLRTVQDSAFLNCEKLDEFDFSTLQDIGQMAFRNTAFSYVCTGTNVRTIGRKAFADCRKLESVDVDEGCQQFGEYCFAKPTMLEYRRSPKYIHQASEAVVLDTIRVAKSVIDIQVGSFRNVKKILCYVGQVAEQFCKAYTVEYELIDSENRDNSQQARLKSKIIQQNPVERLLNALEKPVKNAQNPDFEMKTSGLFKQPIELRQEAFEFFKFALPKDPVEPKIRFKACVEYLQDVQKQQSSFFTRKTFQYFNACNIVTETIYNDGYNAIYCVNIVVMDDMTTGKFIAVLQGYNVVGLFDCDRFTKVEIGHGEQDDQNIPIKTYLHTGDKLGEFGTISGEPAQGMFKDYGYRRVGEMMLNSLMDYGIKVSVTKKDYYLYIPQASKTAIAIHDECKYEEDEETGKRVLTGNKSDRYVVITNILTYEEFIEAIKKQNKNRNSSMDFFDNINQLQQSSIDRKINQVGTIEVEKEAQLFRIQKQFKEKVDSVFGVELTRKDLARISPELLTFSMFKELQRQYWMVPKPAQWLKQVGKKSLNKVAEYDIEGYKVIDYISNMIVKFNNPYMNGVKHAHIFEVRKGMYIEAVLASRYSLLNIVEKLYELTTYPKDIQPIDLMTNQDKVDSVDARLFYNFYPVLSTKNGWDIRDYIVLQRSFGYLKVYYFDFYIAMYKPTGVFYLVQYGWKLEDDNKAKYRGKGTKKEEPKRNILVAHPLFPIGNMDRALVVAATTNINSKNFKVLKELMAVQVQSVFNDTDKMFRYRPQEAQLSVYNNYIRAREMLIQGIRDAKAYKALVDDRAVYMMGTVHTGQLQREQEVQYDSDEDDEYELDTSSLDESDTVESYDIDDVDDLGMQDEQTEDDEDIGELLLDDDELSDDADDGQETVSSTGNQADDIAKDIDEYFNSVMGMTDDGGEDDEYIDFDEDDEEYIEDEE